jgi:Ca2+-binding EF-hand superfamily protein
MNVRIPMTCLRVAGVAALFCFAPLRAAVAHENVDEEFQKMDSNNDGKISPDEHAAGAKAMFDKMDTNNDGKVTPAEMDAAHDKMVGKHGDKAGKTGLTSAEKIAMFDTNNDGVLSADEHAAGAKVMFDKMDTDHDGHLTKAELKAGHEKMMSKMHDKA